MPRAAVPFAAHPGGGACVPSLLRLDAWVALCGLCRQRAWGAAASLFVEGGLPPLPPPHPMSVNASARLHQGSLKHQAMAWSWTVGF